MERFAFRKLTVYQRAKKMVREVNRLAQAIPRNHLDLVWQLRRAARSVVLNIAEGAGEYSPKEKARIYRIARRSAWETVAALDLAVEDGFLREKDLEVALEELDAVIGMVTNMGKNAERKFEQRRSKRAVVPRPRPRPRPRKGRDEVRRPDK